MKRFSLLYLGALTGLLVTVAPPAAVADEYDKKTVITLNAPTEVPGIVLEPGTYVIKLLNSSSNRHIAEIMNERMDHLYALTFTAAAEKVDRTGKTVLTFYEGSNGRPPALRKWFWPGDTIGQEFIYPKDQAARISAATKEKVPEGNLPTVAESGQSLTPDNAKGLSSEATESKSTGPATPLTAPAAEPEKAPAPAPRALAQNTPPPPPQRANDELRQSDRDAVTPNPPAQSNPAPLSAANDTDRALPQTASPLPLIGAIGMASLALALLVGLIRRRGSVNG